VGGGGGGAGGGKGGAKGAGVIRGGSAENSLSSKKGGSLRSGTRWLDKKGASCRAVKGG